MKAILIPVILLVLGAGTGTGAALFLRPAAATGAAPVTPAPGDHGAPAEGPPPAAEADATPAAEAGSHDGEPADVPYVELPSQFIIPVVDGAEVTAMIVLTLALAVQPGAEELTQSHEPRLRAAFLQVLFDHANTGGFSGQFTAGSNMRSLRHALLVAAQDVLADAVTEVLILDLLRQDV